MKEIDTDYMKFLNHLNTFMNSDPIKDKYFVFPFWIDFQTAIFSELRRLEYEAQYFSQPNH